MTRNKTIKVQGGALMIEVDDADSSVKIRSREIADVCLRVRKEDVVNLIVALAQAVHDGKPEHTDELTKKRGFGSGLAELTIDERKQLSETYCLENAKMCKKNLGGFTCTREKRHFGPHIAHTYAHSSLVLKGVAAVWDDKWLTNKRGIDDFDDTLEPFERERLMKTFCEDRDAMCGNKKSPWICTRKQGHDGPHVGHTPPSQDRKIVGVWD